MKKTSIETKERIILSCMLDETFLIDELSFLEPAHFTAVQENIKGKTFYRDVYKMIRNLYHKNGGVSSIDLLVNGVSFIAYNQSPHKSNAIRFAKSIFNEFQLNFLQEGIKKINFKNLDVASNDLSLLLETIDYSYEQSKDLKSINIDSYIKKFDANRENKSKVGLELKTLPTMNQIIGGILPGDLVGIYGKEKSSKTTIAHEIVCDVALDQKIPTAVFNFEMDALQLVMKTISMRTGIEINELRNPMFTKLSEQEYKSHMEKIKLKFEATNLFIIDSMVNENQLFYKAKQLVKNRGVRLIVVDYLMLIEANKNFNQRRDELNYLSRFFKRMANKLEVPIILISQANESGSREAEAKGLSRDANYYFYVEALEEGQTVELSHRRYTASKGDYVVAVRGIRHGIGNKAFITRFVDNRYVEISTDEFPETEINEEYPW